MMQCKKKPKRLPFLNSNKLEENSIYYLLLIFILLLLISNE